MVGAAQGFIVCSSLPVTWLRSLQVLAHAQMLAQARPHCRAKVGESWHGHEEGAHRPSPALGMEPLSGQWLVNQLSCSFSQQTVAEAVSWARHCAWQWWWVQAPVPFSCLLTGSDPLEVMSQSLAVVIFGGLVVWGGVCFSLLYFNFIFYFLDR